MKKTIGMLIACILAITLAGCGGNNHEGEAKTPSGSSVQEGRAYQDVINEFEEHGFTNIKTVVLDDLVFGWLVDDGEVESVSVNGDVDYSSDTWYPNDVEVVVTYHTFPEEDAEQKNKETAEEILSIENNDDLVALFSNGEDEELCKEFVERYKGRTIEFDGNIADVAPHGDDDTRYNILIYAGDYSEVSAYGPAMQFKDKSFSDLHFTGDNTPNEVRTGDNLHFVAKVDDLVNGYLVILIPVSTQIR